MTGELRVQRREPCAYPMWAKAGLCERGINAFCDGGVCNGDGTRWVTVGELRETSLWVELDGDDFDVFTAEPVGDGTTYIRRLYVTEEAS